MNRSDSGYNAKVVIKDRPCRYTVCLQGLVEKQRRKSSVMTIIQVGEMKYRIRYIISGIKNREEQFELKVQLQTTNSGQVVWVTNRCMRKLHSQKYLQKDTKVKATSERTCNYNKMI